MTHRMLVRAATHLVAGALALGAATSLGCQMILVTPGNDPRGLGVFEPELRYEHDKLYATIVVPGDRAHIEARLSGPGAPSAPLVLTETCESYDAAAEWDANRQHPPDADACAFALPRAEAREGTYTITLSSGGTTFRRTSFALVRVPGAGGGTALIVDPTLRRGKAYVHANRFTTWLPVDASYYQREGLIDLATGGVDHERSPFTMMPRRIEREDDPAVDLRPASVALSSPRGDVTVQAVALLGGQRLGSWEFRYGRADERWRRGELTAITGAALGDYVIVDAAPAAASVETTMPANISDDENIVPRVCAVLSDAGALKLAVELEEMQRKGHGADVTQDSTSIGSVSVGGSSYDVSVGHGVRGDDHGPPVVGGRQARDGRHVGCAQDAPQRGGPEVRGEAREARRHRGALRQGVHGEDLEGRRVGAYLRRR